MPEDATNGAARTNPSLAPLLLRDREAALLCGMSVASWHRLNSAGKIPAPIRPSPGVVRWRRLELERWIERGCPTRDEWEGEHGNYS